MKRREMLGLLAAAPLAGLEWSPADVQRAAEAVARKLKALAAGTQVICVTPLPQIASFADHHYAIEKREAGGRSRTRIRRLEPAQRTEEIARMLSGAKLSETSRKHAEQLLKTKA